MKEKDFASMSKKELKAYCDELRTELSKAEWFLQNRKEVQEEESSPHSDP